MRIVSATAPVEDSLRGAVVALGNFDGVHRGHAALLAEASAVARAASRPLAAAVFDPHPREFFAPDAPTFLLTDLDTKARLLGELGATTVFVLTFDAALSGMSAPEFVSTILGERLGAGAVVVGEEFRFGKGRAGDTAMLQELCTGQDCSVHIVTPLGDDGGSAKFSSTDARACIREGDMRGAAAVLGRTWSVTGEVLQGDQRGRLIGFPTANLQPGRILHPTPGVYAVRIRHGERRFDGIANFGRRPTIGDLNDPLLEAHIFDFDDTIYGERLEVAFIDFIRAEQKFDGLDALKAQIAQDCEAARALLAAEKV